MRCAALSLRRCAPHQPSGGAAEPASPRARRGACPGGHSPGWGRSRAASAANVAPSHNGVAACLSVHPVTSDTKERGARCSESSEGTAPRGRPARWDPVGCYRKVSGTPRLRGRAAMFIPRRCSSRSGPAARPHRQRRPEPALGSELGPGAAPPGQTVTGLRRHPAPLAAHLMHRPCRSSGGCLRVCTEMRVSK